MPRRAPGRSAQELEALLAARERELSDQRARAARAEALLAEERQRSDAARGVLRAVSRAAGDPQPVLDGLVESAGRLLRTALTRLQRMDGGRLAFAAAWWDPAHPRAAVYAAGIVEALERARAGASPAPRRGAVSERAVLEARTVHVADVGAHADEFPDSVAAYGAHGPTSALAAPLLGRAGVLGVLTFFRDDAGGFAPEEIAAAESFADQAVIAIENARLFAELQESNASLREALEQQTATAHVLEVISRSPTD